MPSGGAHTVASVRSSRVVKNTLRSARQATNLLESPGPNTCMLMGSWVIFTHSTTLVSYFFIFYFLFFIFEHQHMKTHYQTLNLKLYSHGVPQLLCISVLISTTVMQVSLLSPSLTHCMWPEGKSFRASFHSLEAFVSTYTVIQCTIKYK